MSQKILTKKWLLYIIINQIFQYIYLGNALSWYNQLEILIFYIINIILVNLICFVIEVYNIENKSEIHKVISVYIYITWYFIFQIKNIDNLLIIPLTQLILWWICIDYMFQSYKDKKINGLKMTLYIMFIGLIYCRLVDYKVFLILYQALLIVLFFFPVLIILLKRRMLNKYGLNIKKKIQALILFSVVLLFEIFIGANHSLFYWQNIDYDLYVITIVLYLSLNIIKDLNLTFHNAKALMYEAGTVARVVLLVVAVIFCYMIGRKHFVNLTVWCFFTFCISIQIHMMCNIERKYRFMTREDITDLQYFEQSINWGIRELQKVHEKEKVFAEFLHDELLQDIIYLKNRLDVPGGKYIETKDVEIIRNLISTVRDTMNSYSPLIIKSISLKENYKNLIKLIQERYKDKDIIVDFYCDKDFFLESPYDILFYRIIRELLNNAFKHANTELIEIHLYLDERSNVILCVKNDGYEGEGEISIGWGTNSLKQDIENIGGTIIISEHSFGVISIVVDVPLLKGSV